MSQKKNKLLVFFTIESQWTMKSADYCIVESIEKILKKKLESIVFFLTSQQMHGKNGNLFWRARTRALLSKMTLNNFPTRSNTKLCKLKHQQTFSQIYFSFICIFFTTFPLYFLILIVNCIWEGISRGVLFDMIWLTVFNGSGMVTFYFVFLDVF